MIWEWFLRSAVQGLLTGAGMLLCLYLFLTLKRELRRAHRRAAVHDEAAAKELTALRTAVEGLEEELRENIRRSELLVEPAPAASGLNLTRRSQALRMHRRGEAPANIAAALAMPQLEVELLLKVEQIGAGKE